MAKTSTLINGMLAVVGLRLERLRSSDAQQAADAAGFYAPEPTCQIPELASLYRQYLGEKTDGLFVEVGAYDGVSFSNSSCLARVGWSGLLIEPIPQFADACRDHYRGNDRIKVINAAAGATNGTVEITIAGPLTSTSGAVVDAYRNVAWAQGSVRAAKQITVPQQRLDDLLDAAGLAGKTIDVVIVDVEGAEEAVFDGFSLSHWAPKMLIVELSHTHPDLHGVAAKDAGLQKAICRAGYEVVYKDRINTVLLLDR
jgi:FkbM family methyltransferase